ncbi:hypothetical protein MKEN_00906300 [Mycena kentingensis (nom. inval.)]|nr:hypothetical protein MKEN_00906300 [Mycena kentingensis (nom. inval.)]
MKHGAQRIGPHNGLMVCHACHGELPPDPCKLFFLPPIHVLEWMCEWAERPSQSRRSFNSAVQHAPQPVRDAIVNCYVHLAGYEHCHFWTNAPALSLTFGQQTFVGIDAKLVQPPQPSLTALMRLLDRTRTLWKLNGVQFCYLYTHILSEYRLSDVISAGTPDGVAVFWKPHLVNLGRIYLALAGDGFGSEARTDSHASDAGGKCGGSRYGGKDGRHSVRKSGGPDEEQDRSVEDQREDVQEGGSKPDQPGVNSNRAAIEAWRLQVVEDAEDHPDPARKPTEVLIFGERAKVDLVQATKGSSAIVSDPALERQRKRRRLASSDGEGPG